MNGDRGKDRAEMRFGGVAVRLDPPERDTVILPLLLEFASQGISFISLHVEAEFYVGREANGYIPFFSRGKLLLGLGEPISPPSEKRRLAEEFLWYAKRRGQIPAFFPVSHEFFAALAELGFGGVAAAVEPLLSLDRFSAAGLRHKGLRTALKKAALHGIECRLRYGVELDEGERQELAAIESAWHIEKGRKGAQLAIAPVPFSGLQHKRYAVASHEGKGCAFASLVPVAAGNGWMVEGLYRLPSAPGGTSERLLAFALEELRDDGFSFLSLGPSWLAAPTAEPTPADADFPKVAALLEWLHVHAPAMLNYRSAHRFKLKFEPDSVAPGFLVVHPARISPELLLTFLSALFQGFDFRNLAQEVWAGISSRLAGRQPASPEDLEEE